MHKTVLPPRGWRLPALIGCCPSTRRAALRLCGTRRSKAAPGVCVNGASSQLGCEQARGGARERRVCVNSASARFGCEQARGGARLHGQPVPVGRIGPCRSCAVGDAGRAGLLTHAHWALRVECRAVLPLNAAPALACVWAWRCAWAAAWPPCSSVRGEVYLAPYFAFRFWCRSAHPRALGLALPMPWGMPCGAPVFQTWSREG